MNGEIPYVLAPGMFKYLRKALQAARQDERQRIKDGLPSPPPPNENDDMGDKFRRIGFNECLQESITLIENK